MRLLHCLWAALVCWCAVVPGSLAKPPAGPALPLQYLKPLPEPPGPSSRRSPIVLSEVLYHPAARTDGRNLQFIEVFNSQVFFEDLSGWSLHGATDFTFPTNSVLPARGYFIVAANPADLRAVYPELAAAGATPVFGPFQGKTSLPDNSGTLRLQNRLGAIVFQLDYRDDQRWPVAADGGGHSLVLARPSYGEGLPYAWGPSELPGGSPGGPEPARLFTPQDAVVINEVLAHGTPTQREFVELYNYSEIAVDLSGCILTDDPSTNRFVIPNGTAIPPRGHLAWYDDLLGFAFNAGGERIFLMASNRARVLDAIRFEAQEKGIAWGRTPDGAAQFSRLQKPTPSVANRPRLPSPVVINEILYHSANELPGDQFIELHNPTTNAVNLTGWRIEAGVHFSFPAEVIIPAGGFVVVAKDLGALVNNYPGQNYQGWLGNFSGSLSGSGERLTLTQPDETYQTNRSGTISTNILHVVVDEVTYGTGGRWGKWSDGGGSSLERRNPLADGRQAANWADSDETKKSPWVPLQITGPADFGNTAADALQILSQGAGEYLIDDISVRVANGTNRVVNGAFAKDISSWTFQGNHQYASWEPTEGATAPGCLRLVATGAGTTGPNRAFTRITTVAANSTVTLQAQVRWLRGAPGLLIRLKGNYLEIPGRVLAVRNLGTPGAPNTTHITAPVPLISEVSHFPVVPRSTDTVRITARITDSAGLDSVVVRYHPDTTTNFVALEMTSAGAGWYTAELPPLTGFQQFYLVASNSLGRVATFPDDAPNRECNIRYGDPLQSGALGQYRLWVSRTNVTRWTKRPALANDPYDTTFVYGTTRAIYNAGSLYSGSPYHAPGYNSPTGNNCDYVLVLPPDDPFLGDTEVNLLQPGNGGGDATGQAEQQAYWITGQLGLPYCHRRTVLVWFNGVKRGVTYDDAQQPNGDFVNQWFPEDNNGDLRKIQLWFEFGIDGISFDPVSATLDNYVSRGQKKLARYRWIWPRRSFGNDPNNYTNLYALVDAVNTRETGDRYTHVLEQATDVDEWFRTDVVEHLVGNNDSYSYGGGQNMYAYKPERGPWKLLIWDIDFAFNSLGPTSDMIGIGGANIGPLNSHPPFFRKYYQAMIDTVQGPLDTNRFNAILDARYSGMRNNGAGSVSSPSAIKSYLRSRRAYLISLINNNTAPLALSPALVNGITSAGNLVTLTGTAPIGARMLTLNGEVLPVVWTSKTAWTAKVPFTTGTNLAQISGLDTHGQPITNPPVNVQVVVTAATEPPEGRIVISEIFPKPADPAGPTWIELHNTANFTAYDLSGWRVDALNYIAPPGTYLPSGGRLVIPSDRFLLGQTYGAQVPVAGEFSGKLDPNGELLQLVQPGTGTAPDRIINELRYATQAPWPDIVPGASLQLIDPAQDNRRPANWLTASRTNRPSEANTVIGAPVTPGIANTGARPLPILGAISLNEVMPVNESTLRDNTGRYEPWLEIYNDAAVDWALKDCYLSVQLSDLGAWRFPTGAVVPVHGFLIVWLDGNLNASTTLAPHANFAAPAQGTLFLSQSVEGHLAVLDQLTFSTAVSDRSFGDFPDGDLLRRHVFLNPTPRGANTLVVPPVPVFINEWMADNASTLADPTDGDFDDWFELYNAGSRPVNLAGYHLSNAKDNPKRFPIPTGYTLAAGGHLLVWADNEAEQNAANRTDLHVDFKLAKAGDTIVFAGPDGEILDAVSFGNQKRDVSQGREPDGGPGIGSFFHPTPRTSNPPAALPALIDNPVDPRTTPTKLQFLGSPGRRYQLQERSTLNSDTDTWSVAGEVLTDPAGRGTLPLTQPTPEASRFFRVVSIPGD